MTKLLRTNTNEYRTNVYKYIDSIIDFEHLPTANRAQKMHSLLAEFERVANYKYNLIKLPNTQERLADYLQGLPIGIDYANYKILEVAKKLHNVTELTEKQEDMIINNWFSHIAFMILQLNNKINAYKLA